MNLNKKEETLVKQWMLDNFKPIRTMNKKTWKVRNICEKVFSGVMYISRAEFCRVAQELGFKVEKNGASMNISQDIFKKLGYLIYD